jgi:hypothetical protein
MRQDDHHAPVLDDLRQDPGRRDRPGPPDQAVRPERWSAADLQQRLNRLPAGHPSSPLNGDGSRKPPPPDLRKLELPPPEQGVEAEESRGESWAQARPALQARWGEHKERWPQADRAPVDRTADEPGSWRGDGGQFLNAEENVVAGHAHDRVSGTERGLTAAQHEIEAEVPGARLAGLKYRLKGEDRFKEKVAEEARAKPDRSIRAIADHIPDALRYTYQFDADRYVDGYWEVRNELEERGHELVMSRNSWDSPDYKGINTRWSTDEGQLFEVQFHTPESFEAKQFTHEAYERLRSGTISEAEGPHLEAFQSEVSAALQLPDGVLTIPDYRQRKPEHG